MSSSSSSSEKTEDAPVHAFWSTQPVIQPGDEPVTTSGPIEPHVPPDQVRQEPYPLPEGYEWTTLNLNVRAQGEELQLFLLENYVEDDDQKFRFAYTVEFLEWALKPPGFHASLHLGVRIISSKELAGFISGVPQNLRVREAMFPAVNLDFLCVHKAHRSKRLTPALILEVTRRYRLLGIFQAFKTSGTVLPTPVAVCRYFHRPINAQKLLDIGFMSSSPSMTIESFIKQYELPASTSLPGWRETQAEDIPHVHDIMTRYMTRFDMVPMFTLAELQHMFLSGRGTEPNINPMRRTNQIVWAYVVETGGTITDFISFFRLPAAILDETLGHSELDAAYLYYYGSTAAEGDALKERLHQLAADALVVAAQAGFDVVNALTLMDNVSFLRDHKFNAGGGLLQYYLYNWRTPLLEGYIPHSPETGGKGVGRGIGLIML